MYDTVRFSNIAYCHSCQNNIIHQQRITCLLWCRSYNPTHNTKTIRIYIYIYTHTHTHTHTNKQIWGSVPQEDTTPYTHHNAFLEETRTRGIISFITQFWDFNCHTNVIFVWTSVNISNMTTFVKRGLFTDSLSCLCKTLYWHTWRWSWHTMKHGVYMKED